MQRTTQALFVSTWNDIYYPLANPNTTNTNKMFTWQNTTPYSAPALTTHGHFCDSRRVTYTAGSPDWSNQPYGILDNSFRRTRNYRNLAGSEPEGSPGPTFFWQKHSPNKIFQHPVQTNLKCPTFENSPLPCRDSSGWLFSMWNIFLMHPISISSGVTFTHCSHLFHMTPCIKWVCIFFPATL